MGEIVESRTDFEPAPSRRGDCWDHAVVESFFDTLKTEKTGHLRILPPRLVIYLVSFPLPLNHRKPFGWSE